jgi:hypothetical protein
MIQLEAQVAGVAGVMSYWLEMQFQQEFQKGSSSKTPAELSLSII